MKNEQPLVSIITLNYNQSIVTCELLKSLNKLTYKNVEVIVVDNASQLDDPSIIEHQFPKVKLVRSPKHLGFARGNNIGISLARGHYLLIINNNAEVTEGFLEPLVNFFKENPEAGMVSPKIRFFSQPETILYAGYTPLHPLKLRNDLIGYQQKDTGQHDMIIETPYAHGAAMMVTSEVVKHAGLIPDIYFLYFEELDWCERIKEAGFKIFYYPNSLVYLKESVSSGKQSPLMTYYKNRNKILYVRRNYKGMNKIRVLIYLYCIAMPKHFIMYLLKGKLRSAWAITRGVWWNLLTFKIHPKCSF
jgi:hypothetical protein